MKTAIQYLILAMAFLLGLISCAPKAIIVEPVTPHAVRARAEVKAAADSSKRVAKSVGTVHEQAQGIAAEVSRATAEVNRLKTLTTVGPGDFAALWTMMTDLRTRTWAHEIKAGDAVVETVEQEHLQATASKTLEALETNAIAHDKGVELLKAHTAKVEKQSAINGVYRTWIIVVAVALSLALIIQFWKPSFLR